MILKLGGALAAALLIAGCQTTATVESCTPDNVTRVLADGECLVIQTYGSAAANNKLVIFIHGDGSSGGASNYLYPHARRFGSKGTISVGLIRPGYFDSDGNTSTGQSDRFEGDGYGPQIVASVAAAVRALKNKYSAKYVVLVGHSGGAAISGTILGKYPNLVDAAVLAACPCDIPTWRFMRRGQDDWTRSLSPHSYANAIPKNTKVIAITGSRDDNTRPVIARDYIATLRRNGVRASYVEVQGAGHNQIVRTREFIDAVALALQDQQSLSPGKSRSSKSALLPDDIKVTKPASSINRRHARFIGIWTGWMCRNRSVDVKIVVERIFSDGAQVVWAAASDRRVGRAQRFQARFVNNEIVGSFGTGAQIVLALRGKGIANLKWIHPNGRRRCVGVLENSNTAGMALDRTRLKLAQ